MGRSHWMAMAGVLSLVVALTAAAQKPREYSTTEAGQLKGKDATVCGTVATVNVARRTGGVPTFINFDKPHPNQTFTVLIWGIDRPKFAAPPESTFIAGKRVCATGLITDYRGKPEIIVHDPKEIRVAAVQGR